VFDLLFIWASDVNWNDEEGIFTCFKWKIVGDYIQMSRADANEKSRQSDDLFTNQRWLIRARQFCRIVASS
jgi:hypothetical protein